jgi:multiple sugar transport system substrate-binding protein
MRSGPHGRVSRRGFLRTAALAGASLGIRPFMYVGVPQAFAQSSGITVLTEAGSLWTTFQKVKAEEFKRREHVEVNFVEVPFAQMPVKVRTEFAANTRAYDVIAMTSFLAEFYDRLVPLDDLWTPANKRDFLPVAAKWSFHDGHYYGVPLINSCEALYYRRDLLEAAGIRPPSADNIWTWEDLYNAARKLNKPPDRYAFVWKGARQATSAYEFVSLLYQNGVGRDGIFDERNEVVINNSAGVEALEFWRRFPREKLMPEGISSYAETEVTTLFTTGKVAMVQNFNYMYQVANDPKTSQVAGKIGVGPMYRGRRREGVMQTGGWQLTIPKTSDHVDVAKKYIEFMTSAASDLEMTLKYDPEPNRFSVLNSPEVAREAPYLRVWAYEYRKSFSPPPIPQLTGILLAIVDAMQKALAGVSSKSALDEAAAKIRDLMR